MALSVSESSYFIYFVQFLVVTVGGQVWLWILYYVLKHNFIFEIKYSALCRRMG